MGKEKKKKRHPLRNLFFFLVAVCAVLLYDSNTRIVTTEYPLQFDNLPAAFDGFRILELSDVHASVFGEDNKKLTDAVKSAAPDIIAVTGDLVDSKADNELAVVLPLMEKLVEIAPVYYVTGNHEWDSGIIRELFTGLESAGVHVLRNRSVEIERGGARIVLIGLDDPNGPADMMKPAEVFARAREQFGDAFTVTLVHRNSFLPLLSELGAEVVICGHAHGGIVRLPFTDGLVGPAREWFPTFTSGVYREGGAAMVVSRGVGNHTGMPRFLNNPHLPVVVLGK
ncbi:MAG: metallophosphoesterase [Oscillospiraceae bacterium]|jgi:predicted MPP superfamily phosphohydrolase|nr:metallophosphoesterase [Oscillospiraceae bacterium]